MALSPALAQWLVSQGHDAVHASPLKLVDGARCSDRLARANKTAGSSLRPISTIPAFLL